MKWTRFSEEQIIGIVKARVATNPVGVRRAQRLGAAALALATPLSRSEVLGAGARRQWARCACQVVEITRSTKRRPSGRIEEAALLARIHAMGETKNGTKSGT